MALKFGEVLAFASGRGYYARREGPNAAQRHRARPTDSQTRPAQPTQQPPKTPALPRTTGLHTPKLVAQGRSQPSRQVRPVPPAPSAMRRRGFDREAELAYVAKYNGQQHGDYSTRGYNPKYEVSRSSNPWKEIETTWDHKSDIDDCTNFVSQALHAGGWSEDSTWNYRRVRLVPAGRGQATTGGASPAWENVRDFVSYSIDSGRATVVPVSKAERGDIIVASLHGGKPGTPDFHPDHMMIVTGHTHDDNPLIASHGTNRFNFRLYGPEGSQSIKGKAPAATFIVLHLNG